MEKKMMLVLFFCLAFGFAWAVDFNFFLLAGYEPTETGSLTVSTDPSLSPSLTVSWPVKGGENGVPRATEGDYVLKLEWTNEPDKKIEIRHDFNTQFNLKGMTFLHVDIFIPVASAKPGQIGIWDDVFGWISAGCTPRHLNEWYTISMAVSGRTQVGLNHIAALILENMPGTSGTAYIDNLRLSKSTEGYCMRNIFFSSYWWSVLQSDYPLGAGPNRYTDEPEDVYVDPNGILHLPILKKNSDWYCSELILNKNLHLGKYAFTVQGTEEPLDANVILGLFVYDVPDSLGNHREIDIEIATWGNANDPNTQYVIQPWNHAGNRHRFNTDIKKTNTHELTWLNKSVLFISYYGEFSLPNHQEPYQKWYYTGQDIPPLGTENVRINFYLRDGLPPGDGQNHEMIIKTFHFVPTGDLNADGIVDLIDFGQFTENWLVGME